MQGLLQPAPALHEIMNAMAGRLNVLQFQDQKRFSGRPLGLQDALIIADPVLASLNRQYLEAKKGRVKLVSQHGSDDPMVEVARDVEESAQSAFQTRYIEVLGDKGAMAQARRLMHACDRIIERRDIANCDEKENKKRKEPSIQNGEDDSKAQTESDIPELLFVFYFLRIFGFGKSQKEEISLSF